MPAFALWIGKGKVSKKGIVSKVPEPGSIVRHGIDWSWDVVGLVEVAMMTLVEGLEAKEIDPGWLWSICVANCGRNCCPLECKGCVHGSRGVG